MLTFIAVCLAVLTLAHLAAAVFIVIAVVDLRRAARAVEVAAYEAQEQVGRIGDATRRVGGIAEMLSSGWVKAGTALLGAALALWTARRRAE
ncbi:MAG: hypothetical protein KGL53_13910 [Elusimicrobia bacterium]|nr:hypothetical protein [Elusimicrobiota bacterium]